MAKSKFTPTEAAYDIALAALANEFKLITPNTTANIAERKAIAKLHNRLLKESPLDGLNIGD